MATNSSDGPIKISKRIEKELHQTKVVIRKLPPDFTEEILLKTLSDIPPYSFFYFAAGDPDLGDLSSSRAYFAFSDEASIVPFRDKYDGLYLESEKGARYRAVVEFAPYQAIPKRQKRKPDSRIATIEQDSDYQAFFEASGEKTKPPSMSELSSYIDTIGTSKVTEVQKTPLIEYLLETRRGSRSGKRSKSGSDSKKKHGKESSKPPKVDSHKDSGGTKGTKESTKGKGEAREGRECAEKRREEVTTSVGVGSKDRPSISDKHREKSGREKRHQARYEENGEVQAEGERKSKVKNRDRPDQAIYSSQGKQRHDRNDYTYKESGRSSKDSSRHHSTSKEVSQEFSRSSRGGGRDQYNPDDKPRRSGWDDYSSKERRHEGGRQSDGYRKSKDSYYDHDSARTRGSGYDREK